MPAPPRAPRRVQLASSVPERPSLPLPRLANARSLPATIERPAYRLPAVATARVSSVARLDPPRTRRVARPALSHARPMVDLRHAWYIEHKNALGSCSDFALIAALTPKKKEDPDKASTSWDEYDPPSELPKDLKDKVGSVCDLMDLR